MVRNSGEAIAFARNSADAGRFIGVGKCMKNVRTAYGIDAAGDVDGDKDADAVDGLKTAKLREPFDVARRRRGGFVYWTGGGNGYGHVAIPTGDGECWSPGSPVRPGYWHKLPLDEVTARWGLTPAAWSADFNGVTVWVPPPPSRPNVDHALDDLDRALKANRRAAAPVVEALRTALSALKGIPRRRR
jgi:hypothetical protein